MRLPYMPTLTPLAPPLAVSRQSVLAVPDGGRVWVLEAPNLGLMQYTVYSKPSLRVQDHPIRMSFDPRSTILWFRTYEILRRPSVSYGGTWTRTGHIKTNKTW